MMDYWNTTNINCGDISICIECGKRFDEEESHHIFFCSDTCKLMFTIKANGWRIKQWKKH